MSSVVLCGQYLTSNCKNAIRQTFKIQDSPPARRPSDRHSIFLKINMVSRAGRELGLNGSPAQNPRLRDAVGQGTFK